MQFTVGQPADKPAAKVTIAEVGQGSQKKGFLRIALLPIVQAKGVDVRMQRPDFSALSEIQHTLRGISKMDAQEFIGVRLFSGDEPAPVLLAQEVSPEPNVWHLKKARIRRGEGMVELSECVLHLSGPKAGMCTEEKGGLELLLELPAVQQAQ